MWLIGTCSIYIEHRHFLPSSLFIDMQWFFSFIFQDEKGTLRRNCIFYFYLGFLQLCWSGSFSEEIGLATYSMCVLKWSETTRDQEGTFSARISLDYMIDSQSQLWSFFSYRKLFYNFCYTVLTFGHNIVDPKLFDRCRDNMPNVLLGRKCKLLTLKRTFSLLTLNRTFFLGVPHSHGITSSF